MIVMNITVGLPEANSNRKNSAQRGVWSEMVQSVLSEEGDLAKDMFVVLSCMNYREHMVGKRAHVEVSMWCMRIGEQLAFLKEKTNVQSLCQTA